MATEASARRLGTSRGAAALILLPAALIVSLAAVSPKLPANVLVQLISAALVLVPPALAGQWLIAVFRIGSQPARWMQFLGAGLGIGAFSLLVLLLGLAGLLLEWVFLGLFGVTAALAALRVVRFRRAARGRDLDLGEVGYEEPEGIGSAGRMRWLWLTAGPLLMLALIAATTPPGLSWTEEGLGYDILEYHLQLPKEYLQHGGIGYLPHNVYANFPANVEMLYLAAMMILGGIHDIGPIANFIHLLLGGLFVFSAWAIARDWDATSAIISGVLAATCGWLVYFSGLAYNEHGLLFFGMAATGAALRLIRATESAAPATGTPVTVRGRIGGWAVIAGILAGLACGCKYTGVPFVAGPLAGVILVLPRTALARRMAWVALFAFGAFVSFSPWLIKTWASTGNPVFPLANEVFQASPPGWSPEQTANWNASHSPTAAQTSAAARLAGLWRHTLGDHYQRFPWAAVVLAGFGVWRRPKGRIELLLASVLAMQLAVWLFATHFFARFAVPMLIPLVLLAGRAAYDLGGLPRAVAACTVAAGGVWSFAAGAQLVAAEWPGVIPSAAISRGELPGAEHLGFVNTELPADSHILLVGEARPFYFERKVTYCVTFSANPFLKALEAGPAAAIGWLRDHEVTHVLVNWSEVRRLSRTYGLWPKVDEAGLRGLLSPLLTGILEPIRMFPAGGPRPGVEVFRVSWAILTVWSPYGAPASA